MRVRFAPSPTGFLHVGGARTALFNWLLARQAGGTFILRIEDTDRERSKPEHVARIRDGLDWLGLDFDEGPLFQADGLIPRHVEDAQLLLDAGHAYRDFTPQRTFAKLRDEAVVAGSGSVARLSRELADKVPPAEQERRLAAREPFAVRFRVPDGETAWDDLVHGQSRFDNSQIEDFIILRSDGTPTYNLAVMSDDAKSRITHVIRGDDHLSNTPKQIMLYQALGRPVPRFGHLPMILGPDGKRLSKRHGAEAVGSYDAGGILPEAMVNFLALLGWSPGDGQEFLSLAELVAAFSLDRVLKKSAVFDLDKLRWLNAKYMAAMPPKELAQKLRERLRYGVDGPSVPQGKNPLSKEAFLRMTVALTPRASTLGEMESMAQPYLRPICHYESKSVKKVWRRDSEQSVHLLTNIKKTLALTPWEEDTLEAELRALADTEKLGVGKVFQPLRLALTGRSASPGIFDVLLILGRERSLRRVEKAVEFLTDS